VCLDYYRQLYSAALEHRGIAYRMRKVTIRYRQRSAELNYIRRDDPEGQGRWSFSSQEATLRRLDTAMAAFLRRVTQGANPGHPRFKGRGWFNVVTWPCDGDRCRWNSQSHAEATRVDLQGVGQVRVHQHHPVNGRVETIILKREGRRWYLMLSCDEVPAELLPATGTAVGSDLGVASLVTTSDGGHVANPRYFAAPADKLATAQRALAGKQRGSNRRRKARDRVAAVHGTIRRQRAHHAHKAALAMVRGHDVIVYEALRITNMTRSEAGTAEAPGTNVAQKSGLNRSILDAG